MPFKSEAQRRYMYKNLPEIAARWEKEYDSKNLPARVKPKKMKNIFKPKKITRLTSRRTKL
jgi:hypothetical protein